MKMLGCGPPSLILVLQKQAWSSQGSREDTVLALTRKALGDQELSMGEGGSFSPTIRNPVSGPTAVNAVITQPPGKADAAEP